VFHVPLRYWVVLIYAAKALFNGHEQVPIDCEQLLPVAFSSDRPGLQRLLLGRLSGDRDRLELAESGL